MRDALTTSSPIIHPVAARSHKILQPVTGLLRDICIAIRVYCRRACIASSRKHLLHWCIKQRDG